MFCRRPPTGHRFGRLAESADRILAWDPDTLFLTHFGPFRRPRQHFQALFERIESWSSTPPPPAARALAYR